MVKAADMMIARRADTQARADVATWKMMAKLNGADALPADAQTYLASYQALLQTTSEPDATEATIDQVYRTYYAAMGGSGPAPVLPSPSVAAVANNVTPFQRPKPQRAAKANAKSNADARTAAWSGTQPGSGSAGSRPRVPALVIFILLVIVVGGLKYLLGW